jgi:hypothetical protein
VEVFLPFTREEEEKDLLHSFENDEWNRGFGCGGRI